MRDMQASLEKLLTDAAEAALIRDLATDRRKRELFARLADHLAMLASSIFDLACKAGLDLAIERSWLVLHESGTYVKFTQARRRMPICSPKQSSVG